MLLLPIHTACLMAQQFKLHDNRLFGVSFCFIFPSFFSLIWPPTNTRNQHTTGRWTNLVIEYKSVEQHLVLVDAQNGRNPVLTRNRRIHWRRIGYLLALFMSKWWIFLDLFAQSRCLCSHAIFVLLIDAKVFFFCRRNTPHRTAWCECQRTHD